MIRNLVAAIFLFALALPAIGIAAPAMAGNEVTVQDCHGMPVKHGKEKQPSNDTMQQHGCIGCIAFYSPLVAIVADPPLVFVPSAELAQKVTGTIPLPALPPPRA